MVYHSAMLALFGECKQCEAHTSVTCWSMEYLSVLAVHVCLILCNSHYHTNSPEAFLPGWDIRCHLRLIQCPVAISQHVVWWTLKMLMLECNFLPSLSVNNCEMKMQFWTLIWFSNSHFPLTGEPFKYDPTFNGPIKNRSCTDVICCILFIIFFVAFIIVGIWGQSMLQDAMTHLQHLSLLLFIHHWIYWEFLHCISIIWVGSVHSLLHFIRNWLFTSVRPVIIIPWFKAHWKCNIPWNTELLHIINASRMKDSPFYNVVNEMFNPPGINSVDRCPWHFNHHTNDLWSISLSFLLLFMSESLGNKLFYPSIFYPKLLSVLSLFVLSINWTNVVLTFLSAFAMGDPRILLYPSDSEGNICGYGDYEWVTWMKKSTLETDIQWL